jgi:hypothetical protein
MKMSVGLPVVASPVPAYTPVIEPGGVNGYIARTRRTGSTPRRTPRPGEAQAGGRRARAAVIERYSMKEQARRLVAVLDGWSARPKARSTAEPARRIADRLVTASAGAPTRGTAWPAPSRVADFAPQGVVLALRQD